MAPLLPLLLRGLRPRHGSKELLKGLSEEPFQGASASASRTGAVTVASRTAKRPAGLSK